MNTMLLSCIFCIGLNSSYSGTVEWLSPVGFNMESPIGPPNMRGTESAFLYFLTKGAEIYIRAAR